MFGKESASHEPKAKRRLLGILVMLKLPCCQRDRSSLASDVKHGRRLDLSFEA